MRFLIAVVLISCCSMQEVDAQTCCSGGVPISSNLGLPASNAGMLQWSLSYDLNTLNTLKNGISTLDDNSRSRKTHSALLQVGYGFTDRLAIDLLFTYIRQERIINGSNFTFTQGLGDAILLLKYKVWATQLEQTTLQLGLGTKFPLGATDHTSEMGLLLNADMQPGSGALDGIGWVQFTHSTNFRPSLSFMTTLTYSYKGINSNYLGGSLSYQFGNEWQITAGISDQLLLGMIRLDPAILFRYRNQGFDKIDENQLPSTGGQWIFIEPSLTWWLRPNLSLGANIQIPILADIEGIQLTPTYRFNASIFYRLGLKKNYSNTKTTR